MYKWKFINRGIFIQLANLYRMTHVYGNVICTKSKSRAILLLLNTIYLFLNNPKKN
jgi:hypothetical protein